MLCIQISLCCTQGEANNSVDTPTIQHYSQSGTIHNNNDNHILLAPPLWCINCVGTKGSEIWQIDDYAKDGGTGEV